MYAFCHQGELKCGNIFGIQLLFSARFANRVNNRTVDLVTGVVLTVMGGVLIILHYWEHIGKLLM